MGYENTVLRSNQPGGVYTFSNPAQGYALPSASQMQDYAFGVQAYTTDLGLVYWNGTSWNAIGGGIVINATNINPTNSATTNTANLNAAIATAYAAGGGTIQLGAYSSPIPINNSSGPILLGVSSTLGSGGADTPYSGVRIVGSG